MRKKKKAEEWFCGFSDPKLISLSSFAKPSSGSRSFKNLLSAQISPVSCNQPPPPQLRKFCVVKRLKHHEGRWLRKPGLEAKHTISSCVTGCRKVKKD